MLSKIAGFEVRFQIGSPVFIAVFAIFFLLVFGGVTIDQLQIGSGGSVNINSPAALTMNVLIFSVFGAIIPTAILSSGVLRDAAFKTEELFFSRPIRERDFVLGRFLGGFLVTALAFTSVPLAFLIGSQMFWLDPELIGPTRLEHYAYAYLAFGVVNMWVIGTILFTVANFTRSTIVTYAAFVGLLVIYFVGLGIASTQPDLRGLIALVDPFGLNTLGEVTRYWTVFEQNSQMPPFEGVLMQNRLLWIGIGAFLLALNVLTFRFRKPALRGSKAGKGEAAPASGAIADIELPRAAVSTGAAAQMGQFRARLGFEVKGVVLNVAFWILLALGLLNTVPLFIFGNEVYGTPNYPVTRIMFNSIAGAFSIIPIVVVIYYAAELMWRERRVGFSDITDATPTPGWVFISAKFLAMTVVIAALVAVGVLAAIATQLVSGYGRIELDQYLIRSVVDLILPITIFAALAIFLQVLMNNRWLGMAAVLVFFIVTLVAARMGLDHNLYLYGAAPSAPYSDMNGYGHFLGISLWFYAYWSFWALFLMVLAYQLWNRGAPVPLLRRLRRLPGSFLRGSAVLAGAAALGAGLTGGWIYYNTNVLNEYLSSNDMRALRAAYERTYLHLDDVAQPTLTQTEYFVDIYPEERRYEVRGSYVVENQTGAAIDTLWLSYGYGTTVREQSVEGGRPAEADDRFLTYAFAFDTPMQPGETRRIDFQVARLNPGFRNSSNVTSANHNGSFFNNFESMPNIGFNRNWRLSDRQERRRERLEPIDRANPLEDESHWTRNGITNSHYVTFRTVVSTSADQIAVAPGYLEREWEADGRRYFEYVMDRPILNFYSWLSARYAVAERERDGVLYQVFHHPEHEWNVERMLQAGEDSIGYFSEHFSPYQYRQYRILEFPAYQTFAQAFPNTIPFSEGIGFIADLSDPEDIDYVYYVTAHEAAHQWWAHQVMAADVQGSTMLIESFAQYSALMVMQQEYGADAMRRFLKFELDRYLSGRGSEAIEEQPLYRVENQQYIHYNKGAVILYALQDYLGEDVVNRVLQRLIELRAYQSDPYATTLDFLRLLREEAGPEHETMIHDFFERIVLFDLKVVSAVATERADGRYDLVLEVEARKFSADGAGQQTEEPIDYLIDIGVFNRDLDGVLEGSGHVIYMEKHRIDETSMRIEMIVDERPVYAGIDPYNKLIDRDSDDNLMRVTLQ